MKTHPAANLFPLLNKDELAALAADIHKHGLREPIWLWRDDDTDYILDGRNRLAACEIAGIPIQSRWYDGDDPVSFVVSENIHRRHLTPGQRDFLALELEPIYAEQAKKRQGQRTDLIPEDIRAELPKSTDNCRAREQAGKATGASGRGVGQAKRIKDKAPDLATKVKNGDMPIDRAERIIRDREAEQRRINQAHAEAETTNINPTIDIRHGDFRDVLAHLRDIDAIITDPPYAHEYLHLLADLAAWADKILTPDGILAILMGQTHLPEVYRLLNGARPYRWTACYLTPGRGYASMARKLQSNWKPLLIYGGGPRFTDVITTVGNSADAKNNHQWGQDYGAFHTIIERLTTPGQTIVDPFMGAGTTLLAAHALGRHTIGADIDIDHVATTRKRLG